MIASLEYVAHGATFEAAAQIVESGLYRQGRLHIHFYECDRRGNIPHGMRVRHGSEVVIVLSARHCVDGGIVFYKAANEAIVSEGIRGVIGAQYFCFIHKAHRNPVNRTVIWERQSDGGVPPVITNARVRLIHNDEIEDDQTMYTVQSGEHMYTPQSMPTDDQYPTTPALREIVGLNPFSPDSDSELPWVTMAQEEMAPSSCASQEMDLSCVKEERSRSSFESARLTDDELSNPPPSKAAKRERHKRKKKRRGRFLQPLKCATG